MNLEEIEKLMMNDIRKYLIDTVFSNSDCIYGNETERLIKIIAGLYEMLHIRTFNEDYDYLWHYYNKVSGGTFDTDFLLMEAAKHNHEVNNNG